MSESISEQTFVTYDKIVLRKSCGISNTYQRDDTVLLRVLKMKLIVILKYILLHILFEMYLC